MTFMTSKYIGRDRRCSRPCEGMRIAAGIVEHQLPRGFDND